MTTADEVYECSSNTDPSSGHSKISSLCCFDSKATTILVITDSECPLKYPDDVLTAEALGCIPLADIRHWLSMSE